MHRALHPFAAVSLALLGACGPAERGTRIVLVTLDTLRYDAAFGPRAAMPELAAAAAAGLVFDAHYAASSSTQPTHATLFTGRHPWQHGVHRNGLVLAAAQHTLPEQLAEAGWWTGAVVASFPLHGRFGFAQGFAEFHDEFTAELSMKEWNDAEVDDNRFHSPADKVTDTALALLDRAAGDRQFLWVHYFDAHAPYGDTGKDAMSTAQLVGAARTASPALPALVERARTLYDRDVAFLDAALGRLLERLEADARFETHVLITADHGESLGDDGSFGHGKRVTPAEVHVPLIVLSPRAAPGRRPDVNGTIDVWATLRSLAGLPRDGGGRDLLAGGEGEAVAFGMRRTYVEPREDVRADGSVHRLDATRQQFYAVREGRQYIGSAAGIDADGAQPEGALRETLLTLFRALEAELAASETGAELLDEESQAALRQMGYLR